MFRLFTVGWFVYAVLLIEIFALRDLKISVPVAVVRDQDATLECTYDLEGDQLYSVKWYFGSREFYRYTPKDKPPIKQFMDSLTKHLTVRKNESNPNVIVLEHVTEWFSGQYSCEVSADQPSFDTGYREASLQVVDLPNKDPYITGLKTRYRLGDILKANCTSEHSNPAANLTWYINGSPVDAHNVRKHHPIHNGRFYTANSILRLHIKKELFVAGRLKIRCLSSIYNIYHCSNEKSVELEKKRHGRISTHQHSKFNTNLMESGASNTSSTSTTPSLANDLSYVQYELSYAAERYPQTKLIFNSPINSANENSHFHTILLTNFLFLLFR